jgi:tetratricopeptide (TPR) repeat protein
MGVNEAVHEYIEREKQDPDYLGFNEKFLVDKGYAYLDAGRINDAIKIFELNIKSHPGSWSVYNNLAEAYSKIGETDSAKMLYKKSLELKPVNNWATEKLKKLE